MKQKREHEFDEHRNQTNKVSGLRWNLKRFLHVHKTPKKSNNPIFFFFFLR